MSWPFGVSGKRSTRERGGPPHGRPIERYLVWRVARPEVYRSAGGRSAGAEAHTVPGAGDTRGGQAALGIRSVVGLARLLRAGHATRALITTRRNLRGVDTTSDVPCHAVSSLGNKRAKQEDRGRVAQGLGLTQHCQRAVKGFPSTLCRRKPTEEVARVGT